MAQYSPQARQTKGIRYGSSSRKATTPLAARIESSTTEPSAPTTYFIKRLAERSGEEIYVIDSAGEKIAASIGNGENRYK